MPAAIGGRPAPDPSGLDTPPPVARYKLAWRVMTAGGVLLPPFLTLSEELPDGRAVKLLAEACVAEAYGAEFRLSTSTGETVFTSALEIKRWDPASATLPPECVRTIWRAENSRRADATSVKHALRQVLERAVATGLLGDVDALGLRRAAHVLIDGRIEL